MVRVMCQTADERERWSEIANFYKSDHFSEIWVYLMREVKIVPSCYSWLSFRTTLMVNSVSRGLSREYQWVRAQSEDR